MCVCVAEARVCRWCGFDPTCWGLTAYEASADGCASRSAVAGCLASCSLVVMDQLTLRHHFCGHEEHRQGRQALTNVRGASERNP